MSKLVYLFNYFYYAIMKIGARAQISTGREDSRDLQDYRVAFLGIVEIALAVSYCESPALGDVINSMTSVRRERSYIWNSLFPR